MLFTELRSELLGGKLEDAQATSVAAIAASSTLLGFRDDELLTALAQRYHSTHIRKCLGQRNYVAIQVGESCTTCSFA